MVVRLTGSAKAYATLGALSSSAGMAVGRGSGKSGVATADFFTRVGKRIAGSF
jgi:hypothetical protein